MMCPVCRVDMIVVERNRIELDYCTECGGTWFGSGELDLLLAGLGVDDCAAWIGDVLKSVEKRSGESVRRCPVCAQKMAKSHIGDEPKVLIDACGRGDGLWFDGGELDQLLVQLSAKAPAGRECDRRVEAFLQETFQARGRT